MTAIDGPSNVIATCSVPAVPPVSTRVVQVSDRAIGFFVVAVLPGVFWTLLIAAAGWLLGHNFSVAALSATGAAITAFLGLIFAAFSMRGAERQ